MDLGIAYVLLIMLLGLPLLLRLLFRALALVILLTAAIDVIVFQIFSFRLQIDDFLPYFSLESVTRVLGGSSMTHQMLLVGGGLAFVIWWFWEPAAKLHVFSKTRAVFSLLVILWLFVGVSVNLFPYPSKQGITYDWVTKSHLVTMLGRPSSRSFPSNYQPVPYEDNASCRASRWGNAETPDKVIVIIWESLSSIHSKKFSPLPLVETWTPELDRWSGRGVAFQDFHANGYNTMSGLVPLMLGNVPFPPPEPYLEPKTLSILRYPSADGANSLASLLKKQRWDHTFVTSADGSYSGKADWLTRNGFKVIDSSDPFFHDQPRFIFDSVPDKALFEYALRDVKTRRLQAPWMMFLETSSTHPPYINPDSGKVDLKGSFQYADRWLGWFLSELDSIGFLDQGLVIITSDHRIMQFPSSKEIEVSGDSAYSHIPLVILGKGISPNISGGRWQQTDLYNSLRSLVSGQSCTSLFRGDVLSNDMAYCHVHPMGGARSTVSARCGNHASGRLKLSGGTVTPQGTTKLSSVNNKLVSAWIQDNRFQQHESFKSKLWVNRSPIFLEDSATQQEEE